MAKKTFVTNIGGNKKKPSPIVQQANIFSVKENIKVLPELETFIRKLTPSEYKLLKEDIAQNGCKDAIILWERDEEFIIIDGHNRYRICTELGVEFQYELKKFASIDEVKDYMSRLQLARRNLTAQEVSYLRGLQYSIKKKAKGGDNKGSKLSTKDALAEEFGVSARTIINDYNHYLGVERLPVEEKLKYLAGESELSKSKIELLGKDNAIGFDDLEAKAESVSSRSTKSPKAPLAESDGWDGFYRTTEKKIRAVIQKNDKQQKERLIKSLEDWLQQLKG